MVVFLEKGITTLRLSKDEEKNKICSIGTRAL
jgi:hypothetical protein